MFWVREPIPTSLYVEGMELLQSVELPWMRPGGNRSRMADRVGGRNCPYSCAKSATNTSLRFARHVAQAASDCTQCTFILMSPYLGMAELDTQTQVFRPFKRRKFYRKKSETDNEEFAEATSQIMSTSSAPFDSQSPRSNSPSQTSDDAAASLADLLRRRKAAHRRKGGVEFTSAAASSAPAPRLGDALIERKEDISSVKLEGMTSRFATQTGQVVEETDKHMYGPFLP